jgi:hypothetical protein
MYPHVCSSGLQPENKPSVPNRLSLGGLRRSCLELRRTCFVTVLLVRALRSARAPSSSVGTFASLGSGQRTRGPFWLKCIQPQKISKNFLSGPHRACQSRFFSFTLYRLGNYSFSILRNSLPNFPFCIRPRPLNYLVPIPLCQAIYRFNFKYHKMRKTIVIFAVVLAVASAFASCASSKGMSGCKMSQGYVGYGSPGH